MFNNSTPGVWAANENGDIVVNEKVIGSFYQNANDASLAAASPDLFAALTKLSAFIKQKLKYDNVLNEVEINEILQDSVKALEKADKK